MTVALNKPLIKISPGLTSRLALIIVIALGFRLAVYFGRLAGDEAFADLTSASDMAIYIGQARRLLLGTWPGGAFGYQPGNSYWLAGLIALSAGNLYTTVILTLILGSLSTIFVFVAAYLFSGSARVGLLAALFLAFYPVSAFYDTTLLIAPAASLWAAVSLAVFGILLHRPELKWAFLAGLVIGIATYFRMTMIALLPAGLVALLIASVPLRRKVMLGAVMLVMFAITLAPASIWNTTHLGEFTLLSTNGGLNLYRGNNRDAAGVNANTQAYYIEHSRGQNWDEAFWTDVKAEPGRWLGLLAHKFGLFWANYEIPNMFDYHKSGTAHAPLLRISPLSFRLLAFLSAAGVLLAFVQPRFWLNPHPILIPAVYILFYAVMISLILVVGRYRIPAIPAMCVTAAMALGMLLSRTEPVKLPKLSISLVGAYALLGVVMFLGNYFPRPRFMPSAKLPDGFIATDLQFGDSIHLRGYQLSSDTFYADDWLIAKLVWQVDSTPDEDYSVFLSLLEDDGERLGQKDLVVGTVSHPWTPMTEWPNGAVFIEEVAIPLDTPDEVVSSPTLWVGLYNKQTLQRLPITDGAGSVFSNKAAALGEVRVIEEQPQPANTPAQPTAIWFSDAVELYGFTLDPPSANPGQMLDVTLYWAVDAPLPVNASVFVHIIDETGSLVAQSDGAPLGGLLPTTLWRSGDRWEDTYSIMLPEDLDAGDYDLVVGTYDWTTGIRVPVTDPGNLPASDNAVNFTSITVTSE